MMTAAELEQALDRWGGDLDRWPPAEALRARALLAAGGKPVQTLQAAQQVDAYLAGLREHAPSSRVAARIRARVADADAAPGLLDQVLGWFGARLWRPAVMALLVTSAGFIVGATVGGPDVDTALAEDVSTLAFNDIYAEIENAQP